MKIIRNIRFLDTPNVEYLKSQLETGEPVRAKKALQDICKAYRSGFRIQHPLLVGVEQNVIGLLYQATDEKVRRWALNALARLGRESTCVAAIVDVLSRHTDEPQTTAAAIAAIYRLSKKAAEILRGLSFDEQMVTLAALQHVDAGKLDLSSLPIDVEQASPDLLRLGLVLVGLDRAPANLLNPRHSNAEMVKALGGHDDDVVSQYSVWAITENPDLGVSDLGIDIREIEQKPANVRAWLFRLLAMTTREAERHMEFLELGMRDPDPEARLGLAVGLKNTYFDGLEALVLDWFVKEDDTDVRHAVLDHMVKQAQHCPNYEEMAAQIFEGEPEGSALRRRMVASASGTSIFGRFKQIEAEGSGDLFKGVMIVNKTTNYNIAGGVQGGAVSIGGDATNFGQAQVHYNPQTIEQIQSELSKAERELHGMKLEGNVKKEALEHVAEAKANQSRTRSRRLSRPLRASKPSPRRRRGRRRLSAGSSRRSVRSRDSDSESRVAHGENDRPDGRPCVFPRSAAQPGNQLAARRARPRALRASRSAGPRCIPVHLCEAGS